MTRLFNLESYIECCQYTRLFPSSEQFDGNNPRAYKAFLQNYPPNPYLPEPILNSNRPSSLEVNPGSLPSRNIGTKLPEGDKSRLFIIRDTMDLMTLIMSNLLEYRDGYLYSSAYHYWNHYQEIFQHNLTQPLVLVDLDSFGSERLISINLSTAEGSTYKFPILDTRNHIKFDYTPRSTYDKICRELAQHILEQNFSLVAQNGEAINHLTEYLKKISLFQIIQHYVNKNAFELIIEVLHNNQFYYKQVTVNLSQIQDIVVRQITSQRFNDRAREYPQYKFVFISQYNIFPNIQRELTEFICLNPTTQEFPRIWQDRNNSEFPLFGIYLDAIKFGVRSLNRLQWIEISSREDNISYEGKTKKLIAQDYFRIRQGMTTASLPIQVNDEDYCINGIPQDYSIEIQNYQGTENVEIRIEFNLTPGSLPELRVTDRENRYRITTALKERQRYRYIPPETINETRKQKSLEQIPLLNRSSDLERFESNLSQIGAELAKISINYTNLNNLLRNSREMLRIITATGNRDLLQFVDTSDNTSVVIRWNQVFQQSQLQLVQKIVIKFFRMRILTIEQRQLLLDAIIFIGKTYKFGIHLSIENLFEQRLVDRIRGNINIYNEYFQCLARIATIEQLQNKYFSWFSDYYKDEKYMWGYGRILLWYYNFNTDLPEYKNHFSAILEHLNSPCSNLNPGYKQNAFLALLYLLTFRDKDNNFCALGSTEEINARRVIEQYSEDRIILRQVSTEKPLNQFFTEMIAGTSTETDVGMLVSAD